jgi:hypothetical protein
LWANSFVLLSLSFYIKGIHLCLHLIRCAFNYSCNFQCDINLYYIYNIKTLTYTCIMNYTEFNWTHSVLSFLIYRRHMTCSIYCSYSYFPWHKPMAALRIRTDTVMNTLLWVLYTKHTKWKHVHVCKVMSILLSQAKPLKLMNALRRNSSWWVL